MSSKDEPVSSRSVRATLKVLFPNSSSAIPRSRYYQTLRTEDVTFNHCWDGDLRLSAIRAAVTRILQNYQSETFKFRPNRNWHFFTFLNFKWFRRHKNQYNGRMFLSKTSSVTNGTNFRCFVLSGVPKGPSANQVRKFYQITNHLPHPFATSTF